MYDISLIHRCDGRYCYYRVCIEYHINYHYANHHYHSYYYDIESFDWSASNGNALSNGNSNYFICVTNFTSENRNTIETNH